MGDVWPRVLVFSLHRSHPAVHYWLGRFGHLSSQKVGYCLGWPLLCGYMSHPVRLDGLLLRPVLQGLPGMPKPPPFSCSRSLRGVAGGWRRVRLTADTPAEGTGLLVARHGAVTLERFWLCALCIISGIGTLISSLVRKQRFVCAHLKHLSS